MDEVRIKKYTNLISSFEKKSQVDLNSKKGNTEDKNNLLEMIEYFSNILIKYFYNEKEMDEILISNSDLDYEQLWYFIECLIKEKKLENLSAFFNNFEKNIDKEIEEKITFLDHQIDQDKNTKRRKVTKSKLSKETESEQDNEGTIEKDKFFNYEEMQKFADMQDNQIIENSDDEESENFSDDLNLNQFELDHNQAGAIKYSDFYKGEDDEEEDEEDEGEEDEEEEDEEDEEEEDDVEDEEEDEEEEDDVEDEEEEEEGGEDMEMHAKAQNKSEKSKKLREEADKKLERDLAEMNEYTSKYFDTETNEFEKEKIEKEEIEKELIAKKHWSMIGEVTGKDRPKNSILALNVDIPKINTHKNDTFLNKTVGKNFESDEDNDELNNKDRNLIDKKNILNEEIELVVKQRIKNFLFDDVEKKKIEDLEILDNENNNNDNEVNFNNLNFSKSKLSLVDEYTKKYENEINNNMNGSSKNKEMNLQKIELMNLFKKIMHSLDSLSNSYFIPKPVLLNGPNDKIATLHIEENTPIILSEKNKKAPEENYAPGHVKMSNEMSKQERKSLRKLKKMKRKKKILSQFKQTQGSSTGGIAELQKRNNYLMDKNKKSKEEKINRAKYGVSSKDQLLQKKVKNKYDYNQGINNAMAYDAEKKK
ncbi:U3 small nucleolar ribonucleoprotein MPP10 [Plasmodium yoelii yoelii]|uniref:U3 small nucleolar ribonucleoprotein MPP10 n=1 Tax=Plasmodium yoelii yoelii TaxID=73239 RepID=A0AAE9WSA5_PLAYO|nr:U3 small nucleolar ribonucleoprotein MPP10 [Plasmodium yoelii yoelii]